MTSDRGISIHRAEQHLAEHFTRLGDPDPQQSATDTIRWLMRQGWRPVPAVVDLPSPAGRARPEVRTAAKQEIDAALAKARFERQQREATS